MSDQPSKWGEIGTPGIESWGGWVREAYHSQLYWPEVAPLYSRIWRSDPEVTVVRHFFDSLSGNLEIRWELPTHIGSRELDKPTDDDLRALDFAYEVSEDIEGGIGEWLNSCMTRVPFFGWGWWEAVPGLRKKDWQPPGDDDWRSSFDDGLIGFRRLAFRHYSSLYRWDIDDATGRLRGMEQHDPPNPIRKIPLDRSLHITYGDNDNPEGLATLEAIWRLERLKYGLEIVQGIGYEHSAGHLSITVEDAEFDKAQVREAARMIMTAQEGNYAAWPKGVKGEIIDVPFGSADPILAAIKYYGILKLSVFGMQWVALSATTGTGSYSAMQDSSSMALLIFNNMASQFVRQADKQIGKRLFEYNRTAFPNLTRRPVMKVSKVDKIIPLPELASFLNAISAIMPLGRDDIIAIRSKSGFLPETPAEEQSQAAVEPEPEPEESPEAAEDAAEENMEPDGTPDNGELAAPPNVTRDGVMVAFPLSRSVAMKLAQSEKTIPAATSILAPAELHITLAFLGRVNEQELEFDDLLEVVEKFASGASEVSGVYRQVKRFHNPDSGYGDAIYAAFESDTIKRFRSKLARMLKRKGFTLSPRPFVPHTTLAYVPSDAGNVKVEIPETEATFNSLLVVWGAETRIVKLSGEANLARRPFVVEPEEQPDDVGHYANVDEGDLESAVRAFERWAEKNAPQYARILRAQVEEESDEQNNG